MENHNNSRYEEIGKRIREAREKEGLTQGELATKLGYNSPTAVSLFEAGERRVKISDLIKIAHILNQDFSYLLRGRAQDKPNVRMALRADKDLDGNDVRQIEFFIEHLKSVKQRQHRGRTGNNKP